MKPTISPAVVKFAIALLSGLFFALGQTFPEYAGELKMLATFLLGAGVVRRPGDQVPLSAKDKARIPTDMMTLLFALSLAHWSAACTIHGHPVDWPKLVKCGAIATEDVVGVVSRILLQDGLQPSITDSAKQELEQLAGKEGPSVIACVVDELIREWTAPGAAQHPTRVAAAARGKDFLAKVGTQVE